MKKHFFLSSAVLYEWNTTRNARIKHGICLNHKTDGYKVGFDRNQVGYTL